MNNALLIALLGWSLASSREAEDLAAVAAHFAMKILHGEKDPDMTADEMSAISRGILLGVGSIHVIEH